MSLPDLPTGVTPNLVIPSSTRESGTCDAGDCSVDQPRCPCAVTFDELIDCTLTGGNGVVAFRPYANGKTLLIWAADNRTLVQTDNPHARLWKTTDWFWQADAGGLAAAHTVAYVTVDAKPAEVEQMWSSREIALAQCEVTGG